jgi:hypothetical protein
MLNSSAGVVSGAFAEREREGSSDDAEKDQHPDRHFGTVIELKLALTGSEAIGGTDLTIPPPASLLSRFRTAPRP